MNTIDSAPSAHPNPSPSALPLPHGTSELTAAYLLGQEISYDPHSGQPLCTEGIKPARGALAGRSVGARAGLEPPRFCPLCGRRMQVQVDPMGWTAACSRHGDIDATIYLDRMPTLPEQG